MLFKVIIKNETFDVPHLDFLKKEKFEPEVEYDVMAIIEGKLLIAHNKTGEMIALFPRNCLRRSNG